MMFVVVVVLRVGIGRHNVKLACKGVFSFASSLGGMVRMLMLCVLCRHQSCCLYYVSLGVLVW